jgi:hypothetical protein
MKIKKSAPPQIQGIEETFQRNILISTFSGSKPICLFKEMTHQNKEKNFASYLTQFRMHDYMQDYSANYIANFYRNILDTLFS